MNDIVNQGWFAVQLLWNRVGYEMSDHLTLIVAATAILLFLWLFLSPTVKNKGT